MSRYPILPPRLNIIEWCPWSHSYGSVACDVLICNSFYVYLRPPNLRHFRPRLKFWRRSCCCCAPLLVVSVHPSSFRSFVTPFLMTLTSLYAIPELYQRGLGPALVGRLVYRHCKLDEMLEHRLQLVNGLSSQSLAAGLKLCAMKHYFKQCCLEFVQDDQSL